MRVLSEDSMKKECNLCLKFRLESTQIQSSSKNTSNKFAATSEGLPVTQFLPN